MLNPHAAPGEYFAHFEAAFPWEETPDQVKAISDVLDDMQAPRPMDRLVCGDVGFGKTEVAMRAACLAILGGKQVAVLAVCHPPFCVWLVERGHSVDCGWCGHAEPIEVVVAVCHGRAHVVATERIELSMSTGARVIGA